MIVKFIKDLSEEETDRFHKSNLWGYMAQHPTENLIHREYYVEYFGNQYIDYSLVVFDKKDFYISLSSFTNNETHSLFGEPINMFDIAAPETLKVIAYNELYAKLEQIAQNGGPNKLNFYSHERTISRYFEKIIDKPKINYESYIDLSLPIDNIKMNIRKSYKSLVNWGYKNMSIVVYDKDNINEDVFEEFHLFHIQVAKRITRSDKSWHLQYLSIKAGLSNYIEGRIDGKLVSGVFTTYGRSHAYYGVAVNDRSLMAQHKPIGHALLIESIIKSKEDGMSRFVLGDVSASDDDKINAISKYKRGFTNTLTDRVSLLIEI